MSARDIEMAQAAVGQARNRFASTAAALRYRVSPGTIAGNAWDGVASKSSALAEDALEAVRRRPMTVSGVLAGIVLFLAREPLWNFMSGLFRKERDDGVVKADLTRSDEPYDLTAPVVRQTNEGVSA